MKTILNRNSKLIFQSSPLIRKELKMKKTFLFMGFMAILSSISITSNAGYIRYCVKWEADFYRPGGNADREIAHATDNKWIIPGITVYLQEKPSTGKLSLRPIKLNNDGCTPYILTEPAGESVLHNLTIMMDFEIEGNRHAKILHRAAPSWGTNDTPYNSIYSKQFSLIAATPSTVETIEVVVPDTDEVRALVAASIVGKMHEELAWPPDTHIHIATQHNEKLCGDPNGGSFALVQIENMNSSSATGKVGRICIKNNGTAFFVQTVAHEIGHIIDAFHDMYMSSHPGDYGADYRADEPGVAQPESHYCQGKERNSHQLHSREWSGTAATEGFAQLFAAAVLHKRNNRNASLYSITYPEPYHSPGGTFFLNVSDEFLFLHLDPGRTIKWTDTLCRPPADFPHFGSDRDWQQFFWGLWAAEDPSKQFEVSEIIAIWKEVHKNWSSANNYEDWDIYTYCIPRTTTGEKGWTCKHMPWQMTTSLLVPGRIPPVSVSDTTAKAIRVSKRYKRGKSWQQVVNAAARIYDDSNSINHNEEKYQHFEDIGARSGVVF